MSFVKIGVTDLDGVLRAKYLSKEKFEQARTKGTGFCNVIFAWDLHDRLYPTGIADEGFADARITIDPDSRRPLPWENDVPFYLADLRDDDGPAGTACPRSLLLRTVVRASDLGLTARFGPEYEWFAYRETPASLASRHYTAPRALSPGMFGYSDLRTGQHVDYLSDLAGTLTTMGIELEGYHTETGPGALEAALAHQEPLEAADRAIVFKQTVKQVSYRHGLLASFMAKPSADLPGCGGHLHQSVWQDDHNVFHDPDSRYGMTPLGEHYLAGQLALLPALLPFFAPNVNSYKRYVPGSWAATHVSWGIDNRTVALRYLPGAPDSARLELRVPGADANPYLVMAAALAAGCYGIERKLPLELPPVSGSAYAQPNGKALQTNLGGAAGELLASGPARALFGEGFIDHFYRSRTEEWNQYQRAVTDWERQRYFELA